MLSQCRTPYPLPPVHSPQDRPRLFPWYLALMPVQRIVNIQNRISRITEHGINALLLQTFHYNLGAIQFCHRFVSSPASLRPFLRKQRLTNIINQCPSFFNLPAAKESAFPAQMYLCKKKTSTFTTTPPSLPCESALLIKAEKIPGKQQGELKLSAPHSPQFCCSTPSMPR